MHALVKNEGTWNEFVPLPRPGTRNLYFRVFMVLTKFVDVYIIGICRNQVNYGGDIILKKNNKNLINDATEWGQKMV